MEQMKIFALVSLMCTSTVFLVHVHSSEYGGNNCSALRCAFEAFFYREGDVSCNQVMPGDTFCGNNVPQAVLWQKKRGDMEYLYALVDVGTGGPWYCPPNDVWHYNLITSAWFRILRGIPHLMLLRNNVKNYDYIYRNDYRKYPEHTFYVLLYYVRTYPKRSIIFTTLTEDIKAEMLRRAEAKANLSYTLQPYGIKHPDDLVASFHFRFNIDTSCTPQPRPTTPAPTKPPIAPTTAVPPTTPAPTKPPIAPTTAVPPTTAAPTITTALTTTAVSTTTVPSTTRSGSAAINNYAVVNAEVIFCAFLMANILMCQ